MGANDPCASACRLAKDAGFKVVAHMMPDLPNVGWERDIESFREFFDNPDFRCYPPPPPPPITA